jgi:mRNA deadenylase 3'-5' endonuclease subunit Ccr4
MKTLRPPPTPTAAVHGSVLRGDCELIHPFRLASVYQLGSTNPTTYHNDFQGTIDFIWFSEEDITLCDRLILRSAEDLYMAGGLPNAVDGAYLVFF